MFLGKCSQLTLNGHLSHLQVIDLRGSKWYLARKILWVSENFHMVLKSLNHMWWVSWTEVLFLCVFFTCGINIWIILCEVLNFWGHCSGFWTVLVFCVEIFLKVRYHFLLCFHFRKRNKSLKWQKLWVIQLTEYSMCHMIPRICKFLVLFRRRRMFLDAVFLKRIPRYYNMLQ